MATEIKLTRGQVAIVDDIDADLAELKWCAITTTTRFYAWRRVTTKPKSKFEYLHRVIAARILGNAIPEGMVIDHIDGNSLNCVRSNLRVCTHQQNIQNKAQSKVNTSGLKGASWSSANKGWRAQIQIDGRVKNLGSFPTIEEAHKAYCIAALTYQAPYHNFGSNSPFTGWTLADFEKPIIQLTLPIAA